MTLAIYGVLKLCSSFVVAHGPLGARSVLHSGAQCRIFMCLHVQCVWKSQGYHRPQIRSKSSQSTVHPFRTEQAVKSLRYRFPIKKPHITWNLFILSINKSADFMIAGMSDVHLYDMLTAGYIGADGTVLLVLLYGCVVLVVSRCADTNQFLAGVACVSENPALPDFIDKRYPGLSRFSAKRF